jgi:hypothetical protein
MKFSEVKVGMVLAQGGQMTPFRDRYNLVIVRGKIPGFLVCDWHQVDDGEYALFNHRKISSKEWNYKNNFFNEATSLTSDEVFKEFVRALFEAPKVEEH